MLEFVQITARVDIGLCVDICSCGYCVDILTCGYWVLRGYLHVWILSCVWISARVDVGFVLKVKESSEQEEEDMIKVILTEGIEEGTFMVKNVEMGAIAITLALKGIEHAMFTTSTGMDNMIDQMQNVLNILFYGVIKR